MAISASLPSIIRNDARTLYDGDLIHYSRVVFHNAQNLNHPYHNFRHMFHVLWLVYDGCSYYSSFLSPRHVRDVLIAALFHDFNHSGMMGDDDLNIERAIRGLKKYILPEDASSVADIVFLIRATQYPPVVTNPSLPDFEAPCVSILKDADLSQAFSTAWIQQVVFGLAAEWGKTPMDVLKLQEPFLKNLKFKTEWAKARFTQETIDAKIQEARDLINLLEVANV